MMAMTFSRKRIEMASFDDSVHVTAADDGLSELDVRVIPEA